jgi:multimeric flavodoxin WrbA
VKILAINGSPHKGNTSDKIQKIEQQLTKYNDVEFEIINLMDTEIKPCKGCFMCFIKGEEKCPLKDDKLTLANKIDACDGLIVATPVYSMHVSFLLKLFIDRMAYVFHRPRYFGKYALVVAVAGNIGLKETLHYLKMTVNAWGFECIGQLGYTAAPKNTPLKTPSPKKDHTNEIVHAFYTSIKQKKPRNLTFRDHLTFRIMQTVYSRLEEMSPYDYQYWKKNKWLDRSTKYFYSNVKRKSIRDGFARFFSWIMGRQMDKGLASE